MTAWTTAAKGWRPLAITALCAALEACGGGGGDPGKPILGTAAAPATATPAPAPAPPLTSTPTSSLVTYKVSGTTDGADVTYINAQGGTAQEAVELPWTTQFTMKPGDFMYISAQNKASSGTITTDILVNGFVVKTTTSSGPFVIAAASGSCC